MTSEIEKTLNLPKIKDALKRVEEEEEKETNEDDNIEGYEENIEEEKLEITSDNISEVMQKAKELRNTLQQLPNSSEYDKRIDEIRTEALQTYKDLMDTGMNVDGRHAHHFIESSINSLRIAMEADNAKLDRKVRLAKLKIEQDRLTLQTKKAEHEMKKDAIDGEIIEGGDGSVSIDRNAVIDRLLQDAKK